MRPSLLCGWIAGALHWLFEASASGVDKENETGQTLAQFFTRYVAFALFVIEE